MAFPPRACRKVTSIVPYPSSKGIWKKEAILSDFWATLRPTKLHKLEDVSDTFDEPFYDELNQSTHAYHDEIDNILDFFVANPVDTEFRSTLIDADVKIEPILDGVDHLLANMDLQQDEMDRITNNFQRSGIKIRDIIDTLFEIKPHDRDLLLNRILHLNNNFSEQLQYVRPADKQLINQFILDLVSLFDCLKIRHQRTGQTHWLNNSHSIKTYAAIIQNKIATDTETVNRIRNTAHLIVNRDNPSTLVQEMSRVHDLYMLSSNYLLTQRQKNAEFFCKLIQEVANRRVDPSVPKSILNYVIIRHPTRGNLINMIPHKRLKIGTTGAIITEPYPIKWRLDVPTVNRNLTASDTQNETTQDAANNLECTFDQLATQSDQTEG